MINDQQKKSQIARDWDAVRKLSKNPPARMLPGSGMVAESRPDDFYNLPMFLAYAALDQILSELKNQRVFACGSWMLGAKMAASRNVLPWQDYDLVDNGREARNDLAHEAILASKVDCLRFIDAIESELKAWGIV